VAEIFVYNPAVINVKRLKNEIKLRSSKKKIKEKNKRKRKRIIQEAIRVIILQLQVPGLRV